MVTRGGCNFVVVGLLSLLVLAAGCQDQKKQRGAATRDAAATQEANGTAKPQADRRADRRTEGSRGAGKKPADPAPQRLYAVQLDAYVVTLPKGAVSDSTEFWRRISEESVDVATHDLLLHNGFRIGQGSLAEWGYFAEIIDRQPSKATILSQVAFQAKDVELLVRKKVPAKNVFVFDGKGDSPAGRSFDDADYVMGMSFWPAPHKTTGDVHVKLVPLVRSARRKLVYVNRDDRRAVDETYPEWIYDLKLEADLSLGNFLVIGPSAQANNTTSLGNAFLIESGGVDRKETVLIFVARSLGQAPLVNGEPAKGGG